MFAVPGWSLSADLIKTQTDTLLVAEKSGDASSSKKRKRGNDKKKKKAKPSVISGANAQDVVAREAKRQRIDGDAVTADGETSSAIQQTTSSDATTPVPVDGSVPPKPNKRERLRLKRAGALPAGEDGSVQSAKVASAKPTPPSAPPTLPGAKLTPLQTAMRQKLIGARFRHLNETLYTTPSQEASSLFESNPTFFDEYHSGFRQQVSTWPENPVNGFVDEIFRRGKIQSPVYGKKRNPNMMALQKDTKASELPLPRNGPTCVVADLGCGDAALANRVAKFGAKLKVQVLSYDLYSTNSVVIKADIAKLPIESGKVNVAIFCLALMGTNWIDFIEEAWRVLHWKGELWVAEIKSRFGRPKQTRVDHSVGKKRKKVDSKQVDDGDVQLVDEMGPAASEPKTDVSAFVDVLRRRGFALHDDESINLSNKMFVIMRFTKSLPPTRGKGVAVQSEQPRPGMGRPNMSKAEEVEIDVEAEASVLKPCLYKIR